MDANIIQLLVEHISLTGNGHDQTGEPEFGPRIARYEWEADEDHSETDTSLQPHFQCGRLALYFPDLISLHMLPSLRALNDVLR